MTANLHEPAIPASAPAGRPYAQTQARVVGIPKEGARAKGLQRPWEYKHSPNRWGYSDERGGWHPRLAIHSPMPGSSGLTEGGGIERVVADLHARGWTIIEIGDPRLGKFKHYIIEHRVQGGKPQYVPMWVMPIVLGTKTRWEVDADMQREFLKTLQDSGIVEPPHPLVIKELILRQQEAVRRCERDVMQNQGSSLYAARLETQRRTLARMRGEDEDQALDEVRELAAIAAERGADEAIAHAKTVKADTMRQRGRPRKGAK